MNLDNVDIEVLHKMSREAGDAYGKALIAHTKNPTPENKLVMDNLLKVDHLPKRIPNKFERPLSSGDSDNLKLRKAD